MRAWGRWLAVVLLLGLGCSSGKPTQPVWVGHVAPLSGPDRRFGEQARQGILLAVESARAEGVTVGGRPIAVRHVDGRGEAGTVRAETVRLLAVNKVAALLAGPDGRTLTLLQAARPYGAPGIAPAEVVGPLSDEAVLVLGAPPAQRGKVLARHALRALKAKRVAVLHDEKSAVCGALVDAFVQPWPTQAVAYGNSERTRLEQVKSLLAGKPDVVLLAVEHRDFGRLRAQLRAAGWSGPILHGGDDVGTEALRREAPLDSDLHLVTVCDRAGLTEEGKAFAKRYEERFHAPPELAAVQGHDAARLLFGILQEACTPGALRIPELRKDGARLLRGRSTFESLTGPVSWHERQPRRRLFVVQLGKAGARLLQTIPPEE